MIPAKEDPDLPRPSRLYRVLTVLIAVVGTAAAVSLAVDYGFEQEQQPLSDEALRAIQMAAVLLFVIRTLVGLASVPVRREYLQTRWLELLVLPTGAIVIGIGWQLHLNVWLLASVLMQGFFVVEFLLHLIRMNALLLRRYHPTRLMVVSFAVVILIGGSLLSLPRASKPQKIGASTSLPHHVLNCYFTAVSAVCVTGLTVYDTPTEFTLFGQIVIILLIQVGGLGILVFGTVFAMLIGQQMSITETVAMQDSVSGPTVGNIARMLRFVVLATFVIEAIGAAILYTMWDPSIACPWRRIYLSLFHSVSAFCNAGFALQSDNMISYRGYWQLYVSLMMLIVIGGLGFPVLRDIYEWVGTRLMPTWRTRVTLGIAGRMERLNLHSKLALAMTAVLIFGGAALLLFFETPTRFNPRYRPGMSAHLMPKPPVMAGETFGQRTLDALFQSVTTRTAGFNSIPTTLTAMSPASIFVMTVLMFIGGGSASTAGGIKTVTAAVIYLAVRATMRRHEQVEAFGRTIPVIQVRQAGAVLVLMMFMVGASVTLLSFTESERAGFLELLFEEVSGLCTVGLSCGITSELTAFGKLVIMANMFIGRLGPLTLLVAMAGREKTRRYRYAEEGVIIG